MRATDTNIGKREKIRIELWPTPKAMESKVLTRWQARKRVEKLRTQGRPKNRAQAVAAASASAAEILAFHGRWDEMVPCAKALLKRRDSVHASNVIDDMHDEAVAEAATDKRFKGKPKELALHGFALAVAFNVDEEIIRRWDRKHPSMHFDEAAEVARALMRKADKAGAWKVLEARLDRWYPGGRSAGAPSSRNRRSGPEGRRPCGLSIVDRESGDTCNHTYISKRHVGASVVRRLLPLRARRARGACTGVIAC